MKKIVSRIVTVMLAIVMVFSFSSCSVMGADLDTLIDFVKNGWDGIYEEKERAEYVAPDPTVRTNEIRENHKATKTQEIREDHKATQTYEITHNHEVTKTYEIREDHLPTHNNEVTDKYRVTTVNHVVDTTSDSTVTSVAATDGID